MIIKLFFVACIFNQCLFSGNFLLKELQVFAQWVTYARLIYGSYLYTFIYLLTDSSAILWCSGLVCALMCVLVNHWQNMKNKLALDTPTELKASCSVVEVLTKVYRVCMCACVRVCVVHVCVHVCVHV